MINRVDELKKEQDHKVLMEFLEQSNFIENERSHEALIDAKYAWDYLMEFDTLTPDNVLGVHNQLLTRLNPRIAGRLRSLNVRVGNKVCPPFNEIPRLLTKWFMNHYSAADDEKIKRAHIAFEKIHPFEDGNGRVGRIILNWQRVKAGLPIMVILEEDRDEYYDWFN